MLPDKEPDEQEFPLTCDCEPPKHGRGISRCKDYGKPYVLKRTTDNRVVMVLETVQDNGITVLSQRLSTGTVGA